MFETIILIRVITYMGQSSLFFGLKGLKGTIICFYVGWSQFSRIYNTKRKSLLGRQHHYPNLRSDKMEQECKDRRKVSKQEDDNPLVHKSVN